MSQLIPQRQEQLDRIEQKPEETPLTGQMLRVFPRRTKATPNDDRVRIGMPGLFDIPGEYDEIHISVTFSWDLPLAERMAKVWGEYGPVRVGGPATGMRGEDFIPGTYIKDGYVITSRGCPNHCWFCSVWRREGQEIRELPITEGWNVLDDNLLACSDEHIKSVFNMLRRQKHPIEFTGGLEAARLKPWMAEALRTLRPKQLFFAYDTPDDLDPLRTAGEMLLKSGFTVASHALRSYVLCGYKGDTFSRAEERMNQAMIAGFMPMAMLFRNYHGETDPEWRRFQRVWARPAIIASRP